MDWSFLLKSFHVCRIRKLKLRIFHQSICQDQKENIILVSTNINTKYLAFLPFIYQCHGLRRCKKRIWRQFKLENWLDLPRLVGIPAESWWDCLNIYNVSLTLIKIYCSFEKLEIHFYAKCQRNNNFISLFSAGDWDWDCHLCFLPSYFICYRILPIGIQIVPPPTLRNQTCRKFPGKCSDLKIHRGRWEGLEWD